MSKFNIFRRIPRPYLGFVALFFLVGATACEQLIQEGAQSAVAEGRALRDLEDTEIRPLEDRLAALQFDEFEPRQREVESLYREIETIQREEIDPLWNQQNNDPWAEGGALFEAQQELQAAYGDIDTAYRDIELESRALEREFNDNQNLSGGSNPRIRALEDERYESQRELDRLYRFGQGPVDDAWKQVNTVSSQPAGDYDANQLQADQLNGKIAGLYDQAAWLQSDLDGRIGEKENLRNNVQQKLDDLYAFGRSPIDDVYAEISRLEGVANDAAFASAAESAAVDAQLDDLRGRRDILQNGLNIRLAQIDVDIASANRERADLVVSYELSINASQLEIDLLAGGDGSTAASSTAATAGGEDRKAELQAEIDRLTAELSSALVPVDDRLSGLFADRDAAVLELQPQIDDLTADIASLEATQSQAGAESAATSAASAELDKLRATAAALESEYTTRVNDLAALLATVEQELATLYNTGQAPIDAVYQEIETLNASLDDLYRASDQQQVSNDAVIDSLVAEAQRLQDELNAQTQQLEEQLYVIDDNLQVLYREGEDNRYDAELAFNEAQRALQDRRYELDDQRWLLDQQQQELYSQNTDPNRDIQEKADLIYATEIQPLQDRIDVLNAEMDELRDEQVALEQELRVAEQTIRDRQHDLEDTVFDILDAATATGDAPVGPDGVTADSPPDPVIGSDAPVVDEPVTVPAP